MDDLLKKTARQLRVAVIGRTEMLLESAARLRSEGHEIGIIGTCAAPAFYLAKEEDFERTARDWGATYFCNANLQRPDIETLLQQASCDLAISMNWLTLIPSRIRSIFPLGIFNAHPGDLPRYRGNACPNWAIINGEPQVTLSIHEMIDELDAGPIACQRSLALNEKIDITDVYAWLRSAVPDAFSELATRLAEGNLALRPQSTDPARALRCYPRQPQDARIDWRASTLAIARLIRASSRPFEGAFCFLNGGQRVTIWKVTVQPVPSPWLAIPGQIAFGEDGDPVVVSGDGMLRLTEIEMDGIANDAEAKQVILRSLRNRLE
jgi:methionyl-tRNA formyltransferase